MNNAFLLLGSNIENRIYYLTSAINSINEQIGIVKQKSKIYQTQPWGYVDDKPYLNLVIEIETSLNAEQLLSSTQKIENNLGRIRTSSGYQARTIDIDILYFNSQIVDNQNLKIPHPLMQNRKFVLVPLADIAPNFVHPILKTNTLQMLKNCKDNCYVQPFEQQ